MVDQSINESLLSEPHHHDHRKPLDHDHRKEYLLGEVEGDSNDRKYSCKMQLFERPFREFSPGLMEQLSREADNDYSLEGEWRGVVGGDKKSGRKN